MRAWLALVVALSALGIIVVLIQPDVYAYVEYAAVPPAPQPNVTDLALANRMLGESRLRERTLRKLAVSAVCRKGRIVTATGGWCLFPDGHTGASGHKPADRGLAAELSGLFDGQSVADFGAGLGQYGEAIRGMRSYVAYDGALNVEEFTFGRVTWLDMTTPFTLAEPVDWVLSLEVGEHMPPESTEDFIASLARNARVGVVVSWAVPWQPGTGCALRTARRGGQLPPASRR